MRRQLPAVSRPLQPRPPRTLATGAQLPLPAGSSLLPHLLPRRSTATRRQISSRQDTSLAAAPHSCCGVINVLASAGLMGPVMCLMSSEVLRNHAPSCL